MLVGKLIPQSWKRYIKNLRITYSNKTLRLNYNSTIIKTIFGYSNIIFREVFLENVVVGDFTYIGEKSIFLNTKIGKFCSIAGNVKCGLGTHPSKKFVSTHPVFYSQNPILDGISFADKQYFKENNHTIIGNDVWIGENAMILGGVKIGDGAIIAAGAIITKDVPSYAIVGGIPAKILKYRFEEEEINFLLKLKWWEFDKEFIKKNFLLFHDVKTLMNSDFLNNTYKYK